MRDGTRRRTLPEEPNINITPLIDVVFVILIAFIVIAPVLELDLVRLASGDRAPSHASVHAEEASMLQIHVMADDTIKVNGMIIAESDLVVILQKERGNSSKQKAQLFHDKQARFGTYQKVKNCLEIAGFEEMNVVLSPS